MATGDLTGNLHRLQSKLRQVKYAKDLDYKSLARGAPKEFLPIIHYLMCDYSRPLTQTIHDAGIPLTGKTDQTFMEAVYKVLRDIFHYVPRLTGTQFFSRGFAEHKVLLVIDIVTMTRLQHMKLTKGSASGRTRSADSKLASKPTKMSSSEPDVVPAAELPDYLLCEDFRPSLNSTASESIGFSPTFQAEQPSAVDIVVGETPLPQIPPMAASSPAVQIIDEEVAPRRPPLGVKGQDTGYNTKENSPTHQAVVKYSELKMHPVIQDVLKQLETSLKEQLQTRARMVLLENKITLLEAQISQKSGRGSSRSSSTSSLEESPEHQLETIDEEDSGHLVIVEDERGASERNIPNEMYRQEEMQDDVVDVGERFSHMIIGTATSLENKQPMPTLFTT